MCQTGGYKIPMVIQTFAGARGHGAMRTPNLPRLFSEYAGIKMVIPSDSGGR